MGIGGISIWQLLIILLIVVMLFGSKRLGSLGNDLGAMIKGFKKAVKEDESTNKPVEQQPHQPGLDSQKGIADKHTQSHKQD